MIKTSHKRFKPSLHCSGIYPGVSLVIFVGREQEWSEKIRKALFTLSRYTTLVRFKATRATSKWSPFQHGLFGINRVIVVPVGPGVQTGTHQGCILRQGELGFIEIDNKYFVPK